MENKPFKQTFKIKNKKMAKQLFLLGCFMMNGNTSMRPPTGEKSFCSNHRNKIKPNSHFSIFQVTVNGYCGNDPNVFLIALTIHSLP